MRRAVERAGVWAAWSRSTAPAPAPSTPATGPDRRAVAEADRRGLDLRAQRARRVRPDDWQRFDLLLVADATVERALLRSAPDGRPGPRCTA